MRTNEAYLAYALRELCNPVGRNQDASLSERIQSAVRGYGYKSIVDFRQALNDFIEANHWAFRTFAKTVPHSEGDSASDDEEISPKILDVELLCSPNSRRRNPACSFVFDGYRWTTIDKLKREDQHHGKEWERTASMRELARDGYKSKDPDFKSLHTILFRTNVPGVANYYFYPRYRNRLHVLDLAPQDIAALPVIIEDAVALTVASINADMAFKRVHDDVSNRWCLLAGHFIRRNKSWVWEASFSSWDDLASGRSCRELDLLIQEVQYLESGYSIQYILNVIDALF